MLAFEIAFRFLKNNKFQTILISLGIAVGISVQIFIGSLIMGLQKDLIDTTIGKTAHITIKNEENIIENYEDLVKKNDDIKLITPTITTNGFITNNETAPIVLKSIDYKNDLLDTKTIDIDGKLPINQNEIIIGKNLSEKLNLKIGETYTIKTPKDINLEYKIVGIYDLKVKALNETLVLTTLDTMQKNFLDKSKVNYIELQVFDVFKADVIAEELQSNLKDYQVINWKDENEQLLSGLNGQSISSLMIQIFVMIAVTLAIASVLIITVVQKQKQLGILKAMGLNNKQSSLVFLFQGLLLGVIGATIGILFGFGLLYSFTTFAKDANGDAVINIYIDYGFILLSWIIAISASLISSLIPAISSKKLSPMEVIRNA